MDFTQLTDQNEHFIADVAHHLTQQLAPIVITSAQVNSWVTGEVALVSGVNAAQLEKAVEFAEAQVPNLDEASEIPHSA